MGMFDSIFLSGRWAVHCPRCGADADEIQTKDLDCELARIRIGDDGVPDITDHPACHPHEELRDLTGAIMAGGGCDNCEHRGRVEYSWMQLRLHFAGGRLVAVTDIRWDHGKDGVVTSPDITGDLFDRLAAYGVRPPWDPQLILGALDRAVHTERCQSIRRQRGEIRHLRDLLERKKRGEARSKALLEERASEIERLKFCNDNHVIAMNNMRAARDDLRKALADLLRTQKLAKVSGNMHERDAAWAVACEVLERDPWMDEPLTEEELAAVEKAGEATRRWE